MGVFRAIVRLARRIDAIGRKEVRQLTRDRLTMAFVVGPPVLLLLLFGYAINQDVRHVRTALVDRSGTSLSRKLVGELEATQTFRFTRRVESEARGLALLQRGEVQVVVVIPPEFARRLYRGRGVELSILVDATDPTVARAVQASANGLAARIAARVQPFVGTGPATALRAPPHDRARFGTRPELIHPEPLRFSILPFYNPELRTPVFVVPGLVGTILTMTMILMTALALVRERERGTFEFLIATPVRRIELMIGKILPYIAIGVLQVGLILGVGVLLFRVPIEGSLVHLTVGATAFIAANLTMGLVISSSAETQLQAMQMTFFFFLPSILLSGFMFPFEAMPQPAQWLGEVLPLTHFLRIVRGVLLRGASLAGLLDEVAAILVFTLAGLTLATARFRKALD